MPRFSLIVPTLGRTTEVAKLFASIVDQNRSDVELIVVDQNGDDRIFPLIEPVLATSLLFQMTTAGTRPNC
jgi:ATP-dependent exoDNAse (exonuclease V) alpha subunit